MRTDTAMKKVGPLFGRVALAAIFLLSALGKLANWHTMVEVVGSKGLPWPAFFLAGALGLELFGGLSVLIGWKARWGGWALVAFLIPVTLVMHNFWAASGPAGQEQMIQFLKNVSIAGGALYVAAFGAGAYSVDALKARPQLQTA